MNKIKEFYKKHREVILYLVFGAFTTVVSLAAYYFTFVVAEKLLGISLDDTTSAGYVAVYTAAQILQWCTGVLFAFVTNKKWVFTDSDKSVSTWKQLSIFAGGRVLTFFLDYGLTYVGIMLLDMLMNGADFKLNIIVEIHINSEFVSKLIVSVIVVVTNYFISKLFVFKKSKKKEDDKTKKP